MQTYISSYFMQKKPLAIVNYNPRFKHYNYVLPFCETGNYDSHMYRAQRNIYRERMNEWLREDISSYKDDYDSDYDNEYYNNDSCQCPCTCGYYDMYEYDNDEYTNDDEDQNDNYCICECNCDVDETETNGSTIKRIYDEVIQILDNKGYTISNHNLFKEDLVYMLYRLTNLR